MSKITTPSSQSKNPSKLSVTTIRFSIFLWSSALILCFSFFLSNSCFWDGAADQFTAVLYGSQNYYSGDGGPPHTASDWMGHNPPKNRKATSMEKDYSTSRAMDLEIINQSVPSRAWDIFPGGFPCYRGQRGLMIQTPAHEGFLFHRPKKVGSTTMVSVVIRLAHTRSPWINETSAPDDDSYDDDGYSDDEDEEDESTKDQIPGIKCLHRSMHGSALGLEYDKRDRSKSFLFSLVRHPTKRAISEFFHFMVSINQVVPSDRNFRRHMRNPNMKHSYLYDLKVTNYTTSTKQKTKLLKSFLRKNKFTNQTEFLNVVKEKKNTRYALALQQRYLQQMNLAETPLRQVVQDILDGYDFIAVTERIDESLVAMKMLLNLTTKEILYTRARSSGTFSNGPRGRPCIYIQPSFVTKGMKHFFESDEWKDTIRGDLLLYHAAHESLDRTIEALGKEEFQRNLREFKASLQLAEANCKGRVRTQCSEGGDPVDPKNKTCYIWGEACDHECINELSM